jgi:hypothetical protein
MKRRNWYGNPSPMTESDWEQFWDFIDRMKLSAVCPGQ